MQNSNKIFIVFSLIFLVNFTLLSGNANASWLGDLVKDSKDAIGQLFESSETELPPLTEIDLQDYPNHYRFNRTIEPQFESPVFYLEVGDPKNPPIILVHGLGDEASKTWLKVIPELENKYHVYALDLPGFGLSKGVYFEYSPEQYSKILDWFIAQYTSVKPALVGHSMGAAVSLYFAANYPERIEKLILVDAAGILERTSYIKQLAKIPETAKEAPKMWQRFDSRLRNFSDKWVEKSGSFYDPTKLLQNNQTLRKLILSDTTGMNAALGLIDTNFSKINFDNVVTTHLIWGIDDPIAPIRTGRTLLAKLPFAKLQAIEGAGHVPMKSHTTQFNQQLLKDLAAQPLSNGKAYLQHQSANNNLNISEDSKQKIGMCEDDDSPYFSGIYQSISLNNCKLAVLDNVTATSFSSMKSIVTINNSRLGQIDTDMQVTTSAITATASQFKGSIQSTRSRLDFAGVYLISNNFAIQSLATTKLVLSLSKIQSPHAQGPIHGFYELNENNLEDKL